MDLETRLTSSTGTQKSAKVLLLALILAAAAALRFYGLNWDDGHWLHPDERQIYFVVLKLDWPHSVADALSPNSALNPRFFAYGSLPFYLLKLVVSLLKPLWTVVRDPDNLHLVGRPLAALFDLGTVYLTYRLARNLLPSPRENGDLRWNYLLAAILAGLAVLSIQLAHFYTADTLLTFFVMLSLNLAADVAKGGGRRRQIALGIALGLALATKVSALPLVFVLIVSYDCRIRNMALGSQSTNSRMQRFTGVIRAMLLPLILAAVVFFLAQPYALLDWQTFLDHTIRESQIARGTFDVPYTLQYAGTWPFFYSVWQTALWGMSLPLGLVAWTGLGWALWRWLRRGSWRDALLLAWVGPYLVITGLLYAKYLRYMLPVVPVFCILAADAVARLAGHRNQGIRDWKPGIGQSGSNRRLAPVVLFLLLLPTLAYALAFAKIYAAPHSWITASEWVYQNVPGGSTIAVEHWDTALPLTVEVGGERSSPTDYDYRILALYDEPDDAAKWQTVTTSLSESDILIIASRRLYGSIPRMPDRYPVGTRYYELLFAKELGFELVGEFTRGPVWLNPRLPPLLGAVPAQLRPDESFVVYDHPRALVFRNADHLAADELLRRLGLGE